MERKIYASHIGNEYQALIQCLEATRDYIGANCGSHDSIDRVWEIVGYVMKNQKIYNGGHIVPFCQEDAYALVMAICGLRIDHFHAYDKINAVIKDLKRGFKVEYIYVPCVNCCL
ncbi:hypothetical protein GPJ56_003137 [Histomonas meleagridis]|uniref:uncharacterized protein n=1 Tax=Histomonas meleagridis TaxID=135588 RepID=UPI00355AA88F|nr:hypothetical protein GPJ56_003137 [Histomonas meleagridis]KAH0801170.1 hypothetical protein GO595_005765 [Histomonas meleagridis]